MKRIVIYPKDIMLITGKSERYSRTIMKRMKLHFKKEEHQCISISELCLYLGLDEEIISGIIK
jgi:hypothetical protein